MQFRVGKIFAETETNAVVMKLWVASRHVLALKRALLAENAPVVVQHEQFLHIFLSRAEEAPLNQDRSFDGSTTPSKR
jgi:hypothetical protein